MKKDDADLLLKVRDLKIKKGETLAEFTCRTRLLFERMQYPPSFREQLKQILSKFNPRLTFEILNLPLKNYQEFLHYVNEHNYIFSRSMDIQKSRTKSRTDLCAVQDQNDSDDEQETQATKSHSESDEEVSLNTVHGRESDRPRNGTKSRNNQSSNRQRLEQNLKNFDRSNNSTKSFPTERSSSDNMTKRDSSNNRPFDKSKLFC